MNLFKVSDLNTLYDVQYPFAMEGLFVVNQEDSSKSSFFTLRYQFRGLIVLLGQEGSLALRVHGVDYVLKAGDILTILPEMKVEPVESTVDFKATVFVMAYDFIEKYTILPELISNTEVLNTPISRATNKDWQTVNEMAQLVTKYYALPKTIVLNQMLQYLVFALLTAVSSTYQSLTAKENLEKSRIKAITDAFFELLNQYGHLERQVSFYAQHLHLTPQHLSTLIKKRTGKSIKSWIGFAVINKAKTYLNTTSLSIKEISDQLEFSDASLFCRYFKRYIGQTPSEYRNWEKK